MLEVSPPAVSVLPPLVTVPAPAREPMVSSSLSVKLPEPFSVTAAVSPRDAPSTCRVAPSATVTAAEATEPVTESVPALTVVSPVYKLVPDNVIVPEPDLVRPPDPDATPENVVLEVSPPAVSVRPPLVTVPAPAKEPMVSSAVVSVKLPEPFSVTAAVSTRDAPSTFRVAPFATVTTVEATEPLTSSLPSLTVVSPA